MTDRGYDAAFFEGQAERSLASARVVLGRVFPLLRPRRLVDVGCGVGTWLRAALDLGADDVFGVDGDYVDPAALLIDRDQFLPANLAATAIPDLLGIRAAQPFDLVICMEVAEHLPHERAPSLVEELASLGDVVLFSAAVPFQYGTNHVNEQWPEYWSILFRGQGFECFDLLRSELWNDPGVEWWYAQNALVYARTGSAAAAAMPAGSRVGGRGLSLVHPDNLLANLLGLPRRFREQASQEEVQDLHRLVEANRRRDTVLPELAAPARAAAAGPEARDVFPGTRTEIYHPEQEIADLSQQLGESGNWLQVTQQALEGERAARLTAEAEAQAVRLAADAKVLEARIAAETEARDARRWREQAQAQAAARLQADTKLAELLDDEAQHQKKLEDERLALLADVEAERTRLASQIQARAAALEARKAELDRQAASIEAVHRSRAWRMIRRAWRIGRRVWLTGAQIAARVRPPVSQPDPVVWEPAPVPAVAELPDAPLIAVQAPPEIMQIKCYERVVGQVEAWLLEAAVRRLKGLEVFDAGDYLRRNPDVSAAGVDPYAHFIQSGALENRGRVDPEDLARIMSSLSLFDHAIRSLAPEEHEDSDLSALVADVNHVGIFVNSHGNVFMEDLADDLASDLRSVGVRADVLDETAEIETRPSTCLFVAPHEFFTLGRGNAWIRDDVLAESFMFGTEQVQTTWFNLSLPFVLMSRGVLDIGWQTASLFERLDMASLHVLPGAQQRPHPLTERDRRHPLYDVLPPAARGDVDPSLPFAARPIDISFFGTSSPRRNGFFARNAAFFADHETFNYVRSPGRGPIRGEGEDGALTRLAGHVAGHSKITLNIHREEFGYFEWHRMVRLGMCSGSLVVSDPCLPHPDFIANEHYLQENARHIPDLLEWLLKTEDGAREAERVRANVDRLITNSFETNHAIARMLRFFAHHRSRKRG
jgi:SAM-dependent methyltransferase